ncbi:EamA family transporter [Streptomyces radiopugnans]|nr:EamA family transporter [Streptomyces radiopugnans]
MTSPSSGPSSGPSTAARRRGALLAAVACCLVGASFTANSVLGDYPHAGGQALRYGLACLLLLPLLGRGAQAPLRLLTARQWARLALLAAVGMVGFNLAVLAAERTAEPAVPGVLVGCAPVVVAVVVPALDGRVSPRARWSTGRCWWRLSALAVQGWGRTDAAGLLWSAAALAGEVGFAVIAVPLVRPLGARLLSAAACALAALEAALLGVVLDGRAWLRMPDPAEAAALLWQAVVVTVVGFVCWYAGVRRIGAERATLFSGLIPVCAALTAPLVATGSYGWAQAGGSLLVGAGVALGAGALTRRPAAPEPEGSAGSPEPSGRVSGTEGAGGRRARAGADHRPGASGMTRPAPDRPRPVRGPLGRPAHRPTRRSRAH